MRYHTLNSGLRSRDQHIDLQFHLLPVFLAAPGTVGSPQGSPTLAAATALHNHPPPCKGRLFLHPCSWRDDKSGNVDIRVTALSLSRAVGHLQPDCAEVTSAL